MLIPLVELLLISVVAALQSLECIERFEEFGRVPDHVNSCYRPAADLNVEWDTSCIQLDRLQELCIVGGEISRTGTEQYPSLSKTAFIIRATGYSARGM